MHIIHTHFHPRRTGITVHVEEIVSALADLGLNARAFGPALSEGTPQVDWKQILQRLEEGTPVLWHAHRPPALRQGIRLRNRFPHLRVVWTHHGWKTPGWLTRTAIKKADGLVALTPTGQNQLPVDSVLIPHGTHMGALHPCPGPPFLVGVLGRIRPDKGHQDITDAFLSVAKEYPEWQLVFYGDIRPVHRRFARGILAQGEGRIGLRPYVVDKTAAYRQLSIVVVPSHAEGFSLVVPEALAAGRALLAARLPHFPTLFKEDVHALCFEPGNSEALAHQLRRLFSDPKLREKLATQGRQHAHSNLQLSKEAESLASLYAELLNRS
jgi:mannosyltransferase